MQPEIILNYYYSRRKIYFGLSKPETTQLMKATKILLLSFSILFNQHLSAQQTVGLFLNSTNSYDGYTLFAPISSKTTYLIDNCGEKAHSWISNYRPGLAVYLLEDGTLLRAGNSNNSTFTSGGKGGIIEMLDWNSNVLWSYTISSSTECQHHDVEYLPNGNILVVVWEAYTSAEVNSAGRSTTPATLWSDKIIEIQPDLVNGGGTIVWEWKAWDHLVQDEDQTASNYGNVGNSPELINLNYGNLSNNDWLHINSVDYNAQLDQIVLSNHNFSEIWIVDHSTTTQEASSHIGGNSGKGGDLLYRWGNPQTYDQGTLGDQKLFLQHNAYWIDDTYVDGNMIMIFNNKTGPNYSSVDIIDPPIDAAGQYTYAGGAYAPGNFHWSYMAPTPSDFFATNISGAQRLANGNTLICEGPTGRFFEVDYTGTIVWEYINPVINTGVLTQGANASGNTVFRAERYARDFAAFTSKTLSPQGYIETGSTFSCNLYVSLEEFTEFSFSAYPNPANDKIQLSADAKISWVALYNTNGQKVAEQFPNNLETTFDLQHLAKGIYIVKVQVNDGGFTTQKILIQ